MHGAVCNTKIMVLFITLDSHFFTNQYKLYSYSYYFHNFLTFFLDDLIRSFD